MADKDELSARGRGPAFVATVLCALPLFYFLSTGPVVAMLKKTNYFGGTIPKDWMINFYAPIIWLYLDTPMRQPIEWYLSIWGVS